MKMILKILSNWNYNNFNNYNNEDIVIVQYLKGAPIKVKTGNLYEINYYIIYNNIDTNKDSSCSLIILLSRKFKIIDS